MLSLTEERQHISMYINCTNRITTLKCLPIETRKEYRYREQRRLSSSNIHCIDVTLESVNILYYKTKVNFK